LQSKNQQSNAAQQMQAKQAIMKTTVRTLWNSLLVVFLATLLAGQARGQIFVANSGSATIGEYDNNSGGTVNVSLVSGLSSPSGIAVSGSYLYVANKTSGTIGVYNATTGATVNPSPLVSGLSGPDGVVVSGSYLYVANNTGGTIGVYNATSGAPVKPSLVSGLNGPSGIAVSGSYLYVANKTSGTIGVYNATSGAPVNPSLVLGLSSPTGVGGPGAPPYAANSGPGTMGKYYTGPGAPLRGGVSGLSGPAGIAVSGANLFVANQSGGTIGEYNATTGATVKASLVSGLSGPNGIAVGVTLPVFNLRTVPLQSNAYGSITVNEALNKIYTSGNPSDSSNCNEGVEVTDGATFATPGKDVGYGQGVSVDNKTNRYWAATVYGNGPISGACPSPPPYPPGVIVRDSTTDSVVATVNLGYCPIQTNYDFFKNRLWASAQCGAGNDPIFAIDATTFKITNGPIDSGGVMGPIIANSANGRLYFITTNGGVVSRRVDPTTFAVTNFAFGTVMAINALTNTLYTVDSANNLQIINGAPDPEVKLHTIPLSYTPTSMGINTALNHLYIAGSPAKSIEVRDPSTGVLITTFALSAYPGVTPGVTPNGPMAVDSIRGRIYVIDNSSLPGRLLVIESLINAYQPDCILSH